MAKMPDLRVPAKLEERKAGAQMDSKASVITAWSMAIVLDGAQRGRVVESVGWVRHGTKSGTPDGR